jgi:hypothetical protein
MSPRVPIRDVAHLRLTMPSDDRWAKDFEWIPVSFTELHLTCRHFPVAIRAGRQGLQLGLLLHERFLSRSTLDASGKWRCTYRPIALRCFPFEAALVGSDPISEIFIDPASKYLSATVGAPIIDEVGRATTLVAELHRLFGILKRSEDLFSKVLDQYLIADLLVPMADESPTGAEGSFYVIDPARFSRMRNATLGAIARSGFLGIDVAISCLFSLQHLKPDRLPNEARLHRQPLVPATVGPDPILLDDLGLALDDSELIPFDLISCRIPTETGGSTR